jgi:23S rRNA (cytosine1962-C5)-methyltransferase
MTEKDGREAEYLRNRLAKNDRILRRWARRESVFAYRLYDRDIPEIPLAIDRYLDSRGELSLVMALYERPYEKEEAAEAEWLGLMAGAAGEALGVPPERIFAKTRRKMRGDAQYERLGSARAERVVLEGGLSFIVNLSDYLDSGLFLDHRPLRARVRGEAAGKRVLNLFCYTGSFSVYAASGGAASVSSVDLSNTYLAWAGRNLAANGFSGPGYPLIRAEARAFLAEARRKGLSWELIVLDPPTFSNSKASELDFDVNRDWPELLGQALDVLAPDGLLYFSTNSRRLRWQPELVHAHAEELGESSVPPDFRDKKIHRAWRIAREESTTIIKGDS